MRFGSVIPLAATVGLLALPGHAAIFVSDVQASGAAPSLTLHYLLNEPATEGSITVATAAAPDTALATIPLTGDNLKQGPHDVAFSTSALAPGEYIYKVSVTAAAHTGYDVILPVTTIPGAQTLSYGVKSNKAEGSPGYGHIFTSDYTAHVVQETNAAGTFVQNIPAPATGDFTPVGLAFDSNGDFYVTDQNIDHIYQFHATGSTIQPTWAQVADFTGPIVDAAQNFGSLMGRGLQLFGTGADAVAYIAAYNPVPNPLTRARLGDTANAPEVLFDGSNIAGTRIDNVLVAPDQKSIYVVSGAAGIAHLNKYIFAPDPFTGDPVWQADPDFSQNSADTATLIQRSRGVVFAADGKSLWMTQSLQNGGAEGNFIARVSLEPLPIDPATTSRILRIAGGLAEAPIDTWFALDLDGNGAIDVADAVAAIRKPSAAGAIIARIPTPTLEGAPGPVLPFTLDTDPAGNLVIGVDADNTQSPIVGTSFYVLALPDDGSSDTATSRPFTVGGA